jgi:hypothetical protein
MRYKLKCHNTQNYKLSIYYLHKIFIINKWKKIYNKASSFTLSLQIFSLESINTISSSYKLKQHLKFIRELWNEYFICTKFNYFYLFILLITDDTILTFIGLFDMFSYTLSNFFILNLFNWNEWYLFQVFSIVLLPAEFT